MYHLIYTNKTKNQDVFSFYPADIPFFYGLPFEKVNARGGKREGAFSLTKGWCAFSLTGKGRAFSLTEEFLIRKQFIEMGGVGIGPPLGEECV